MSCARSFSFAFSRRALIAAGTLAAGLLAAVPADAGALRHDYSLADSLDFSTNKGKFYAGATDITVYLTDGSVGGTISIMPNFSGFCAYKSAAKGNGGGTLISPQYVLSVSHAGESNENSRILFYYSQDAEVSYVTAGSTALEEDQLVIRLEKIVTEATYNPVATDIATLVTQGTMLYRLGNGKYYQINEDGSVTAVSTGDVAIGGMTEVSSVTANYVEAGNYKIRSDLDKEDVDTVLGTVTQSGDSGSPLYVWNAETMQFEVVGTMSTSTFGGYGGFMNWNINPTAVYAAMDAYDSDVVASDSADGTIYWNTDGTLTQGENSWEYHGITNGYEQNDTIGLVFSASGDEAQEIRITDNIDLGAGSITFSAGTFLLTADTTDAVELESAGFIVERGATVTTTFTGTGEWRKVGEGTLIIAGEGDNDIDLNVGGGVQRFDENYNTIREGEVRLNRTDGYAAATIKLSAGIASIVLMADGQINGADSFTFGTGGGLLNVNGHDLEWDVINHEDSGATIGSIMLSDATESPADATFTFTGSGTFMGAFTDGVGSGAGEGTGLLKVVYNASDASSTWTLTGTSDNAGGFEVSAGTLILQGSLTEHQSYTDYSDWNWAALDSEGGVTVNNGATFRLSHHAVSSADVTVNEGTFELWHAVNAASESVTGSERLDTTTFSEAFTGNVTLASTSAEMIVNADSVVDLSYSGNITGTGNFSKTGAGTVILKGENTFSGTKTIEEGKVSFASEAAFGDVSAEKWVVGAAGVFASTGTSAETALAAIDTSSAGVLALTADQSAQLDISEYSTLYVGADAGTTVEYGTAGTTEELSAVDGAWRLGGGGGTLVVNFVLSGENDLLIGSEYTTGTVHLANTANTFSGNIVIGGLGNYLTYDNIAALGSARISVEYGNLMDIQGASASVIAAIGTDSTGALVLSSADGSDVADALDLSATSHTNVALGAAGTVRYTGALTAWTSDGGYAFGGSGTLVLATELSGSGAMTIDGQGLSGGEIIFAAESADYTGAITVGGNLEGASSSAGAITLSFENEKALANAASIALKSGATLALTDSDAYVNNLSTASGAAVVNNDASTTRSLYATYDADYSLAAGTLTDGEGALNFVKLGTGTLTLNTNTDFSGTLTVNEGTLAGTTKSESSSSFGTSDASIVVNEGGTLAVTLYGSFGAAAASYDSSDFDNVNVFQSVTGTGRVEVSVARTSYSWTLTLSGITIGSGTYYSAKTTAFLAGQEEAFEGTLAVTDSSRLLLGENLNDKSNLTALNTATIEVESGSQVRVTNNIDGTSNDAISTTANFVISGSGFSGPTSFDWNGQYGATVLTVDSGKASGALSVDCGSVVYGTVTLAADATISSWNYGNGLDGTIAGAILGGSDKTLTLGGDRGLILKADAASDYGDLVINSSNGNGGFALQVGLGAEQSTVSTALGGGTVTLIAGGVLDFANAETADTSVVYTYQNNFSLNSGAVLLGSGNTTELTGTVTLASTAATLETSGDAVLNLRGGIVGGSDTTLTVSAGSNVGIGGSASAAFAGTIDAGAGASVTLLETAAGTLGSTAAVTFADSLTLNFEGSGEFTLASVTGTASDDETATSLTLGFDFTAGTAGSSLALSSLDAGTVTLEISLNEAGDLKKGEYTLVSGVDFSTLNYTLDETSLANSRISLSVSDSAVTLVVGNDSRLFWQNDSSDVAWDESTQHWTNDEDGATSFDSGDSVVFGADGVAAENSAGSRESVSLAGDISAGSVLVKDETFYSFTGTGAISGESLQVAGASLELANGANTFSGGVTVGKNNDSAGELIVASAGALTDSAVSLAEGGTLEVAADGALAGTTTVAFDGGELRYSSNTDVSSLLYKGTGEITLDLNGQSAVAFSDSTNLAGETISVRDSTGTAAGIVFGTEDTAFAFTSDGALDVGEGVTASHHAGTDGALGALSGAGTYALASGSVTVDSVEDFTGTVSVAADANLTYSQTVAAADVLELTTVGEGTLTVSLGSGNGSGVAGLENFSGTLEVASGLLLASSSSLGTTTVSLAAGANLVFNDTGTVLAGDVVFQGTGSTIHANNGKDGEIAGTVSASGLTVTRAGAGTLTLSGDGSEFGSITHSGTGTTIFAGADTSVTGTLTVSKGSFSVYGDGASFGTIATAGTGGTFTFGDGENEVLITVGRFATGSSSSGSAETVEIASGATLKITGTGNGTAYSGRSLLIAQTGAAGTLNVAGTLLAQDAELSVGDVGATIDVSGGTLAVKGISLGVAASDSLTQAVSLSLSNNGKIILGESGISEEMTSKDGWSGSLGAGTVAASADSSTISGEWMLNDTSNAVVFDTTKYEFASDGNSIARGSDAATLKLSGALSGAGAIQVAGTGTLQISGEVLAGSVTVSETGTLEVASGGSLSTSGDSIVVESGASLVLNGSVTISNVLADDVSAGTASATIQNSGTLTVGENVVFALSADSTDFGTGTTIQLYSTDGTISDGSVSTLAAANFTVNGSVLSGRISVSYDAAAGTATLAGAVISELIWNGGTSGVWNTTDENFVADGYDALTFYNTESVRFSTAGANVTLGEALTASAVVVSADTTLTTDAEHSFSADSVLIESGAALTLDGTGTANEMAAVSAAGTINVNAAMSAETISGAGTVNINADTSVSDSVSATGALNVANGATLSIAGTLSSSAAVTVESGATLALEAETDGFSASNISGAGTVEVSLSQTYGNALALGSSDFSGTLYVKSGYFTYTSDMLAAGTTLTLADGVYAQIVTTGQTFSGNLVIEGDTQFHTNQSYTMTLDESSTLTGAGTFDKRGNGSMTVNGNVDIGGITVTAGTLTLAGESATVGNLTVASGKTLNLATDTTVTGTASLTGTVSLSDGVTLSVTSAQSGFSTGLTGAGDVNVALSTSYSNALTVGVTGTTTVTSGYFTLTSSTIADGGTLILSDGVNFQVSSSGQTFSGDLVINGTSHEFHCNSGTSLTFDESSSLSGDRYYRRGAGTLTVNGAVDLTKFDQSGSGSSGTNYIASSQSVKIGTMAMTYGTTYVYGGTRFEVGSLSIATNDNSAFTFGSATLATSGSVSGNFALSSTLDDDYAGTTFEVADTLSVAGTISGDGALVKTGDGTLTLTGTNTFSGGASVSAGTLVVGADSALGTGEITLNGGILEIASGVTLANTAISIALGEAYLAATGTTASVASVSVTAISTDYVTAAANSTVLVTAISDDSAAAITAEDSTSALASDTKITLEAGDDLDLAALVAGTAAEYNFQIVDSALASQLTDESFELGSSLSEVATASYDSSTGVLTLVAVPEPGAFGALAGAFALAFAAARRSRRRSRKAA